jgi:molecular chaperone HscB
MDPFAVLGVEPSLSLDAGALERRYRELLRVLHPDKHTQKPPAERRMMLERATEVTEAFRILSDDVRRAEAVLRARGVSLDEQDREQDGELLMAMMEFRERIAEARAARDGAALAALKEEAAKERGAVLEALETADAASAKAAAQLGRLRYYQRLLSDIDAAESLLEGD